MTTLSLPAAAAVVTTPFRAVGTFLGNFIDGVREGQAIMHRYDRLSRLSNSELRRYGLDRQRIAQAAARGFDIG
jgi:hypothetical protein